MTDTVSADLVAWLRAQLDDDERAALGGRHNPSVGVLRWTASHSRGAEWLVGNGRELIGWVEGERDADHIARHDPARVLAEVDAKRRVLDLHAGDHECSTIRHGVDWDGQSVEEIDSCTWVLGGDCSTVRLLALPYAAHPDYREEWRP